MDIYRHSFLTILIVLEGIVLIRTNMLLTAVNDSYYAGYFYMRLRNLASSNLFPNDRPGVTASDVCNQIIGSGYFDHQGVDPVNMNFDDNTPERYVQARQEALHIQIELTYWMTVFLHPPYIRARLTFEGFAGNRYLARAPITEFVFVCLGEKRLSGELVIYYVSKEYNSAEDFSLLGSMLGSRIYKPVRFVFKPILEGLPPIALAEQPAKEYTNPDFNVEQQYIRMRERNTPVQDPALDPLCQLTSREHVALNQHERLCAVIFSSPYFEGRERYPQKPRFDEGCVRRQVAFQSELAINVVSREYYEWMLECRATVTGNVYYISRTYSRHRLFVYTGSAGSSIAFLENLTFRIRFIDGPNRLFTRDQN